MDYVPGTWPDSPQVNKAREAGLRDHRPRFPCKKARVTFTRIGSHAVSKNDLQRYVAEFEFRYNTRDVDDGERVLQAIRGAEGKRLLYAQPR